MNYYIDTEFLEGKQKEKFPINLFRKETPNTIDLISIGIVSEDNRKYYAISKDFNLKEAWNRWQPNEEWLDGKEYWIRDNVLRPIFIELLNKQYSNEPAFYDKYKYGFTISNDCRNIPFDFDNFKKLINKYGKTNKQIADEIKEFVYVNEYKKSRSKENNTITIGKYLSEDRIVFTDHTFKEHPCGNVSDFKNIQFYAYFADYDWFAFWWLFGKMIDLPNGFPMYCIDLKQILDEKAYKLLEIEKKYIDPLTLESGLDIIKHMPSYPKQTKEHSAIHDARWNKELHQFLINI